MEIVRVVVYEIPECEDCFFRHVGLVGEGAVAWCGLSDARILSTDRPDWCLLVEEGEE